ILLLMHIQLLPMQINMLGIILQNYILFHLVHALN
ncbi:glycosyl transferase, partial [Escherichia coli FRIK1990]